MDYREKDFRDLHFIDIEAHDLLQPKIIEKMLASLIRKIDAERRA